MVDHRRTPRQRAYRLPGWFFLLTGALSVLSLAAVGWVLVASPSGPGGPSSSASARPVPSVSPSSVPAPDPTVDAKDDPKDEARTGIEVVILNASRTTGLAATVAEAAEKAGWTIATTGNWIYPAAVNAVYYPEGHQDEAEVLADDLDIASVRAAIRGLSADALTVLLVSAP